VTEQGITSKHLLVATAQGAILDLPLHMVDPRRPALNTPAHLREPGIPPYIPELALPHENVMNYNQTLQGIRGTSMNNISHIIFLVNFSLFYVGHRHRHR
jgi:hypothetical protein